MQSFKNYKSVILTEEEADAQSQKDALQWLHNKYGEELYTFKYVDNLSMEGEKTKTYDIAVGENEYILDLKKFDSNNDGDADTVAYNVRPSVNPEDDEDEL